MLFIPCSGRGICDVLKFMKINYVEIAAVILFGIGFTTLLLNRNLIRKIIGFSFS